MTGVLRGWFAVPLWQRVLGAMVVGVLLGLLWPAATGAIAFIGELFVRLIRMLVVPIVFISIASGVTALADPRKLGSVGARTVGLFAATTFCAVSIGIIVGLLLEPGQGAALGSATCTPAPAATPARSTSMLWAKIATMPDTTTVHSVMTAA